MRFALFAVALLATVGTASAQSERFERLERTSNGVTITYGLFVPEDYDPTVAYPLVMALHGAGERGSDYRNLTVGDAATNGLTTWATPQVQDEHPAFVLAPQVPSDRRWSAETDPDQSDLTAVQLTTLEILESVEAEYSIDPDRIYVAGLSMGGHGTWDFVSRLPGRFAAAVPMSGEGFPSQAETLLHLPIWAFTGESDTVVPPGETRRVIQRLEDLGRDVIYTHCRRSPIGARAYGCPGYIGTDSLAAALDAHADLIYWSEPSVGHGPWGPWFRNGLMQDWLFSKVRQDPDAVTITAPASGARWAGTETVTWTTTRSTADVVEVWLNRTDDPASWQKLGEAPIAAGTFEVDTEAAEDAARARVRLWVRNADGRIAGRATSAPFALDNPGDASPELTLQAEGLRFDPRLGGTEYTLSFLAADPDGDALTAEVAYSLDGGQTYTVIDTPDLGAGAEQAVEIDLAALPNSREARFLVSLSDGTTTVSEETVSFLKQTPRDENTFVQRVAGDGEGTVTLHFVDPAALTGHEYRISIAVAEDGTKTYDVTDVDEGETVLEGVPLSDGILESPVFDGIALVVEDLDEGRANPEQTGWVAGDTDLGVTVSGGTARVAILTIDLLATETDYEVTVADEVVGQSTAIYTFPATDVRFTVTGDGGQPREVAFDDADDDGQLGDGDVLYILEPDAAGELELAWKLEFEDGEVAPEAGDVFRLVPVRSLGAGDVFQFEGRFNTTVEASPETASLEAFPNPFGDRLTVAYRLAAPAAVRVEVFDALGRRVALLVDGPSPADGQVRWNARGVASGVYVVRLTTEADGAAPASVRRSVVRVGR
ncbi:alpha/beta hydrolase-fold protein [Rubrivirga marina]|uniref:Secretion system C-terminal sorting domain-containing protein n=1 Tax=Rubrivirga marina TaxID=1196024 RepID=A0A271IXH9_9BACT|nr:T9SS type A sorting domain-containing protein [Rubrivirga marina]PAP75648.1 hypothetical protein BSZ37_03955 [Rubrivirga marina]